MKENLKYFAPEVIFHKLSDTQQKCLLAIKTDPITKKMTVPTNGFVYYSYLREIQFLEKMGFITQATDDENSNVYYTLTQEGEELANYIQTKRNE